MQLKLHSFVTDLHLGWTCVEFTCGLPGTVYATFFHFLCPEKTFFFFFWLLLVCISEFLFLSFYSQVGEECLGSGCTWIRSPGTTRKPLYAFPSIYLGASSAEALGNDISDLTVFRNVCDTSVPSLGCLNFINWALCPFWCNCSNFSIMHCWCFSGNLGVILKWFLLNPTFPHLIFQSGIVT